MKDIIEQLTRKERMALMFLCAVLVIVLGFQVFFASAERTKYRDSLTARKAEAVNLKEAREERDQRQTEMEKWKKTLEDLQTVKEDYLYGKENHLRQIRLDLEEMFRETGLSGPSLEYEYENFSKEELGVVRIQFIVSGVYTRLKRFINTIETVPRFLVLDKVDFLDIDPRTGFLKLRIKVAGYYDR